MLELIYESILTKEQLTKENMKILNSGMFYSSITKLEDENNLVITYKKGDIKL